MYIPKVQRSLYFQHNSCRAHAVPQLLYMYIMVGMYMYMYIMVGMYMYMYMYMINRHLRKTKEILYTNQIPRQQPFKEKLLPRVGLEPTTFSVLD